MAKTGDNPLVPEEPLGELGGAGWTTEQPRPPQPTWQQWSESERDRRTAEREARLDSHAAEHNTRVFWLVVGLVAAVLAVIIFSMSQRNDPERMAAYVAPLSALAGVVFGYFFGERAR